MSKVAEYRKKPVEVSVRFVRDGNKEAPDIGFAGKHGFQTPQSAFDGGARTHEMPSGFGECRAGPGRHKSRARLTCKVVKERGRQVQGRIKRNDRNLTGFFARMAVL